MPDVYWLWHLKYYGVHKNHDYIVYLKIFMNNSTTKLFLPKYVMFINKFLQKIDLYKKLIIRYSLNYKLVIY